MTTTTTTEAARGKDRNRTKKRKAKQERGQERVQLFGFFSCPFVVSFFLLSPSRIFVRPSLLVSVSWLGCSCAGLPVRSCLRIALTFVSLRRGWVPCIFLLVVRCPVMFRSLFRLHIIQNRSSPLRRAPRRWLPHEKKNSLSLLSPRLRWCLPAALASLLSLEKPQKNGTLWLLFLFLLQCNFGISYFPKRVLRLADLVMIVVVV